MSSFEVIAGDFAPGIVRTRFSAAGRPFIRLRGLDGAAVSLWLGTQIAGVAEAGTNGIRSYVRTWLRREGLESLEHLEYGAPAGQTTVERRIFVLVTRDGRKFLGRASVAALAELNDYCGFSPRPKPGEFDYPRDRLTISMPRMISWRLNAARAAEAQSSHLHASAHPGTHGFVARLLRRWI